MLAGVDEVGRGPLAGPVVTAAVILSPDDPLLGSYRDSKKVSEKKRLRQYHHIRTHALAYSVTMASVEEIDRKRYAFSHQECLWMAIVSLT